MQEDFVLIIPAYGFTTAPAMILFGLNNEKGGVIGLGGVAAHRAQAGVEVAGCGRQDFVGKVEVRKGEWTFAQEGDRVDDHKGVIRLEVDEDPIVLVPGCVVCDPCAGEFYIPKGPKVDQRSLGRGVVAIGFQKFEGRLFFPQEAVAYDQAIVVIVCTVFSVGKFFSIAAVV